MCEPNKQQTVKTIDKIIKPNWEKRTLRHVRGPRIRHRVEQNIKTNTQTEKFSNTEFTVPRSNQVSTFQRELAWCWPKMWCAVVHRHFCLFENVPLGYLSVVKSAEKVASLPSSFQTITYIYPDRWQVGQTQWQKSKSCQSSVWGKTKKEPDERGRSHMRWRSTENGFVFVFL